MHTVGLGVTCTAHHASDRWFRRMKNGDGQKRSASYAVSLETAGYYFRISLAAEQTSSGETDKQSDRDSEVSYCHHALSPESCLAKHPCQAKTRYNWNPTYTNVRHFGFRFNCVISAWAMGSSKQSQWTSLLNVSTYSPCEYGNNSSTCQMLKWNEEASDSLKYLGHFLWNISQNGSRPTLPIFSFGDSK